MANRFVVKETAWKVRQGMLILPFSHSSDDTRGTFSGQLVPWYTLQKRPPRPTAFLALRDWGKHRKWISVLPKCRTFFIEISASFRKRKRGVSDEKTASFASPTGTFLGNKKNISDDFILFFLHPRSLFLFPLSFPTAEASRTTATINNRRSREIRRFTKMPKKWWKKENIEAKEWK